MGSDSRKRRKEKKDKPSAFMKELNAIANKGFGGTWQEIKESGISSDSEKKKRRRRGK